MESDTDDLIKTKSGANFIIPELSHPNYRLLEWGKVRFRRVRPANRRRRFTSYMRAERRRFPTFCSFFSYLPKEEYTVPELTAEELARLFQHYRSGDGIPFCIRSNPLIGSEPIASKLESRLRKWTGCHEAVICDPKFFQKIRKKMTKRTVERDSTLEIREFFKDDPAAAAGTPKVKLSNKPNPLGHRSAISISPNRPMTMLGRPVSLLSTAKRAKSVQSNHPYTQYLSTNGMDYDVEKILPRFASKDAGHVESLYDLAEFVVSKSPLKKCPMNHIWYENPFDKTVTPEITHYAKQS
ncbi:unnamed protein product [Calicophoron daubneyi]|uniref:Uncharacterized protein n=1 Tax=Calicophoron daubneyi TaxID=300641 RepID=A0AAV2TIK0_CALDB